MKKSIAYKIWVNMKNNIFSYFKSMFQRGLLKAKIILIGAYKICIVKGTKTIPHRRRKWKNIVVGILQWT